MKESAFSEPERILRDSGEGEIRHWELFPGIELSYNRFFAGTITMEHHALPHVLEINYCHSGRIGWDMKGGVSVYLGPGDMDVHTMDFCAVSTINLPLGHYEGIGILLDLDQLQSASLPLIQDTGIDIKKLKQKLCLDTRPLSLPASKELERIFSILYEPLPESLRLSYYRLKALELLLYLERLQPEQEKHLNQYYSSQVEIVKEIHDKLTKDLQTRFTIEELSKEYLINTSTLKAVFKAVYSQPIGSYMKEYRIHRAMELLRQTDHSIAAIAQEVGYESQGKFATAFKDVTGFLPTQYRKVGREKA